MDVKAAKTLEKIAAESLEKCVARLSRVSAGEWSVADSSVSCRSMEEAVKDHSSRGGGESAGVYFEVDGNYPFTSMVVFRPEDIDVLSRGFLGCGFYKLPSLNQAQELLFSELGNIIINSLASSLSGVMKTSCIPSVPKCVRGETPFLLEALWASMDRSGRHNMVTVVLDLRCDGAVTRSEVIALIPSEMEAVLAAEA